MAEFVPYDDKKHRNQFLDFNVEYLTWIRDELLNKYGRHLFPDDVTVQDYVEKMLPKFTNARPPEGAVYILEVDGKMAGIGALRKLEERVAEVKRVSG